MMAVLHRWRWPRWAALLLLGLALAGCGLGATPTATPAPPQGRLACFPQLDTVPATAPPPVSRAQAEAIVRDSEVNSNSQKRMNLGDVVDEHYVTVIASGIRRPPEGEDPLRGHDAWVLGFAHDHGRWYAMLDAHTGEFLSRCGGSAAGFGAPTPVTGR